jgi:hypothetical protein
MTSSLPDAVSPTDEFIVASSVFSTAGQLYGLVLSDKWMEVGDGARGGKQDAQTSSGCKMVSFTKFNVLDIWFCRLGG